MFAIISIVLIMGVVESLPITDNLAIPSCYEYPGAAYHSIDACAGIGEEKLCQSLIEGLGGMRYVNRITIPGDGECEVRQEDYSNFNFNTSCHPNFLQVNYTNASYITDGDNAGECYIS